MAKVKDPGQVKARLDKDLAARVAWIFFCNKTLTQQSLLVELVEKWLEIQETIHGIDPRKNATPARTAKVGAKR